MTSQTINLNLIPGSIEPVINVSQYDKGQTWNFNIYSGSQPFTIPTGSSITIQGTKPDKTGFQYGCTFNGNVVTAIEQQQMTILSGKVPAEIVITKDDELIGSLNFNIMVEKAALADDTAISETDLPLIEEAVEALSHIDETLETMKGYKEDSEAYAIGKRNGSDVGSSDPAYHNNSKYYAGQASSSASSASGSATSAGTNALISEGYAVGKQNGSAVGSGSPYYQNNAEYYKGQAANSATNAGNSATAASGSATTASNKALVAEGYADGKQNGTDVASGSPYYHNNSKYYSEQAAASAQSAAQSAASLTVDSALSTSSTNPVQNKVITTDLNDVKQALNNLEDNLTATVSDNEPYVLRQGKGSLVDMDLVGGTVAWNQLLPNGNFADDSSWVSSGAYISMSNNVCTITAERANPYVSQHMASKLVMGHMYLAMLQAKQDESGEMFISTQYTVNSILKNTSTAVGSWVNLFHLGTVKTITNDLILFDPHSKSDGDKLYIKNFVCFDLTLMFGTTIADYIYSLEQATAGTGVAWFRQYFPKSYYAYNAGNLLSVKPSGRKVVGFNGFNKSSALLGTYIAQNGTTGSNSNFYCSDFIRAFSNTDYYFNHVVGTSSISYSIFEYDKDKNLIGAYNAGSGGNVGVGGKEYIHTTSNNCCYIRFNGAILSFEEAVVNLSDTSRNGEYEPYNSSEYTFSQTDLRGYPKLVDGKLAFDGDVRSAERGITRKYGIVDLGSLTFARLQLANQYAFACDLTGFKGTANAISSKYSIIVNALTDLSQDKTIYVYPNRAALYIRDDSYTDAATFKTAMSGVYLVYELATPTTESAPIFINPQRSFADGTEEWLDERDVTIPVGNNSTYYQNDTYSPVTAYANGVGNQKVSWEDNAVLGAHNQLKAEVSSLTFPVSANTNWGFGKMMLKAGERWIYSAKQETNQTSNTRNMILVQKTAGDAIYEEVCSTNYHTYAGVHTLEFTVPSDGEYQFRVWCHSPNVETVYSEPMVRLAIDNDPTYQPCAMTNQQLTADKAEKSDLASISITGTTNTTGAAITGGTYFYLNGALVRAKTSIANNATFTLNTNYEVVTGVLNDLNSDYVYYESTTIASGASKTITLPRNNEAYQILIGSANGSVWGYAGVAFTSSQNPSVVDTTNVSSNLSVTISGKTLTITNGNAQYEFSGIIKII